MVFGDKSWFFYSEILLIEILHPNHWRNSEKLGERDEVQGARNTETEDGTDKYGEVSSTAQHSNSPA